MRTQLIQLVLFSLIFSLSSASQAQNKVAVIPDGKSDLVPIIIPQESEPEPEVPDTGGAVYLDQAIGKPIVWNKGWDTSIGNRTQLDPTVNIAFQRLEPVFGYPGIIYTGQNIAHWGLQTAFASSLAIYAKGVILVDRGDFVEGGPFEWSTNNQGFMSFHNIVRKDYPAAWIRAWTDPRPGDKVWFFIMSDDERFSSNPISFRWP